jgi:hypothetical protein
MRLLLTKLENITLTIMTILLTLYPSCLLLLVRPGGYIVNLCDFYSYKLIGKLTTFLHLQESRFRNLPVVSSTSPRAALSVQLKSKIDNILVKVVQPQHISCVLPFIWPDLLFIPSMENYSLSPFTYSHVFIEHPYFTHSPFYFTNSVCIPFVYLDLLVNICRKRM